MDVLDLGRYFGALLLVAALLGFAWLAARKYGGKGLGGFAGFMTPNAQRRLSVVETLMMGPRHKLYLLRRDGVEHLIVVGPDGASVVENGIAAQTRAAEHMPMMAQESTV
ncbi:MAG TPA: flagellar biosynthetic protein FliO [Rhizomicrobium sp.]